MPGCRKPVPCASTRCAVSAPAASTTATTATAETNRLTMNLPCSFLLARLPACSLARSLACLLACLLCVCVHGAARRPPGRIDVGRRRLARLLHEVREEARHALEPGRRDDVQDFAGRVIE